MAKNTLRNSFTVKNHYEMIIYNYFLNLNKLDYILFVFVKKKFKFNYIDSRWGDNMMLTDNLSGLYYSFKTYHKINLRLC